MTRINARIWEPRRLFEGVGRANWNQYLGAIASRRLVWWDQHRTTSPVGGPQL